MLSKHLNIPRFDARWNFLFKTKANLSCIFFLEKNLCFLSIFNFHSFKTIDEDHTEHNWYMPKINIFISPFCRGNSISCQLNQQIASWFCSLLSIFIEAKSSLILKLEKRKTSKLWNENWTKVQNFWLLFDVVLLFLGFGHFGYKH